MVHAIIENDLREKIGLPKLKYEPRYSDKKFIRMEALREKRGLPNRYTLKKEKCVPAYHEFWNDYIGNDIQPVYIEKRVGCPAIGMGTVDLVCLITLLGRTYKLNNHVWFRECDCKKDDKCKCKMIRNILVLDWKSGKSYQKKSYQMQGAAYIHSILESELMDTANFPMNDHAWCVLLGGTSKDPITKEKLNYTLGKGSYHEGIIEYIEAMKIYKDPHGAIKKKFPEMTLTGKCMFCSYLLQCPNKVVTDASENDVKLDDGSNDTAS
jgi:hypothetical protein